MRRRIASLALAAVGAVYAAAGDGGDKGAKAVLQDAQGNEVGVVTFRQATDGVRLEGKLKGVAPGTRAIHIHETGKCDAPDFESAGDHFNPTDAKHGAMGSGEHHAGDMPNIEVDDKGKARIEVVNPAVTLASGDETSLFKPGGTALVVHEGPDDYQSQPSGDAGGRVACGVIVAR